MFLQKTYLLSTIQLSLKAHLKFSINEKKILQSLLEVILMNWKFHSKV